MAVSTPSSILASGLSWYRKSDPNKGWTWNGKTYYGSTAAMSDSEVAEYVPEGSRNAANADPRAVSFTPSDFPGGVGPGEGQQITRNVSGVVYTIVHGYLTDMGGAWRVLCFRVAPTAESTDNAAQEAAWSQ